MEFSSPSPSLFWFSLNQPRESEKELTPNFFNALLQALRRRFIPPQPSLVHITTTLDSEYLLGSVHSVLTSKACFLPRNVFFHFIRSSPPCSTRPTFRVLTRLVVRSTFPSLNIMVYVICEDIRKEN